MRYFVIHKKKRLVSTQDDLVQLIGQDSLEKRGRTIREYGYLLGWILSLFGKTFKAHDSHGNLVFVDRQSFLDYLLCLKEESKEHKINPLTPHEEEKLIKNLFLRESKKLTQSHPEDVPDLIALYDTMREELAKEIDRLETLYYPDDNYITRED